MTLPKTVYYILLYIYINVCINIIQHTKPCFCFFSGTIILLGLPQLVNRTSAPQDGDVIEPQKRCEVPWWQMRLRNDATAQLQVPKFEIPYDHRRSSYISG